jgi:hypothetical protein
MKHGGRQCWGVRKIGWSPRTQKFRTLITQVMKAAERRQGISESIHSRQKLWIPLHVPSRPLLQGDEGNFYIPKIPSKLGNIPSVNTYKNVLYIPWFAGLISYIYKPATSSHVKPGLFEVASLTWLLSYFQTSPPWFPNFGDSHPQFRRSEIPDLRRFRIPDLHRLMIPGLRRFVIPEFRRFQSSWNRQ